jgi:hypothetical protein
MVTFKISDIQVEPLKNAAVELGIPNAATAKRDELEAEIKKHLALDGVLVFAPMAPMGGRDHRPSRWWQNPSLVSFVLPLLAVVIAGAAALFSGLNALADWRSADAAINQLNATIQSHLKEEGRKKVQEWQEVMVFSIIEQGTKNADKGISFEEIKNKYLVEATAVEDVDLKKEELRPLTLKRILIDLMMIGVVYQTLDDNYVVQRAWINPRPERSFLEERAKYAILHLLSTDGGRLTVPELGQVITDKLKITNEEFNALVSQLIAGNALIIDEDKKVWCVANPPRFKMPTKDH